MGNSALRSNGPGEQEKARLNGNWKSCMDCNLWQIVQSYGGGTCVFNRVRAWCGRLGWRSDRTLKPAINTNEAELIARVIGGEKELFHELIRPYERMVYLTLFSIVKNEAEAEDGAQEAVISAYRNLGSFRAEAKFSTWLTTIAINEGRKRLRRAKGAVEEPIEEHVEAREGDYTPAPLTDWREIPLEALERKELREALRRAVAELPDIYRHVFTLRDLEEFNIEETAQALGLSANVVKVRLHRARIMLQKKLVPLLKTTAPTRRGLFGRWL